MKLSGYIFLTRRSLLRNPGRTLWRLFGMAVGTFFLSIALFGYFGVRKPILNELGRAFPEKRLVVKPKTLELGPLKMNRTKLNAVIIDQIKDLEGVENVYPIQPINFPVRAEGTIFGQQIMTDIVVNGAPPQLVENSIAPGEKFSGSDYTPEKPAPVVISRYFLDLYNFGIAQSNNLPKFNESTAIGREFDLVLGESTISGLVHTKKSRRIRCRVVGFTPDVSLFGIILPLEIVKVLNSWYHGRVILDYTLAHVDLQDVQDAGKVTASLQNLGLAVESHKELLDQFRFILNIISIVVIIFAVCLLIFTVVSFAQSESLSLMERKDELGLLHALGARRAVIMHLILGEKMLLGFCGGLIGVGVLLSCWLVFKSRFGEAAGNIPVLGGAINNVALSPWVIVGVVLFSMLWGAVLCGIMARGYLLTPASRLMKK